MLKVKLLAQKEMLFKYLKVKLTKEKYIYFPFLNTYTDFCTDPALLLSSQQHMFSV